MKKQLLLIGVLLSATSTFATLPDPEVGGTKWEAPEVPGEDLSTLNESTDVFVYNIEADAIFSRGFNWLTMALADRPEGGDNATPAARQKVQIRRDGNNIKIHWNDRGADVFFGQADNTDEGQMWTYLGNAGDRVVFTPAVSENYPKAYTLTNVKHNQKVDVLWKRGGKLTLWNGKGYYDWAFMTADAFTSGKLAQFKVRKAMWNLYQALEKVNALDANADALATALNVYANADATTDELRAAFRAMFLATAASIEDPVDVSYIFTHPDMSGDKTAQGWSYSDFAISAGECEKYHVAFSSTQTITDAPNGLYDVTMTGIYRQDGGQTQDAPQLIVSNGTTEMTGNFPNMDLMGGKWNIGGNETGDWVNSSTGKMPKWMWSASDAQSQDDAGVKIENVKVEDYTLGITFKVTGGDQWFNFQRIFVTYKGSINAGLYKSLQEKIQEATDFATENTGVLPASFISAITDAVSAASSLDANSSADDLNNAFEAINDALTAAKTAPTIANIEALQATIALAKNEGVDTSSWDAILANPTSANDVRNALEAVTLARKMNAVDKQPDIFTGSAPVDGGQYYIYNVGAQRYLTGGVDYGTHAAVNYAAQIATFRVNGNGFRIHTNIRNGSDALNFNGFVDCGGDGDTWFLNEVAEGVYTIAQNESGEGKCFLGYNGPARNNWWQVDSDCADASNPNNQWKLISKAERDALMEGATAENPVDATYYIHAAGFDHWLVPAELAWPFTKWTWNNGGDGGWEPDFVYEVWHAGETEMSQTIEGLPAGKYIATVQGYYRDGDDYNYQGDRQEASFFAGDAEILLPNISAGADKCLLRGSTGGGHGMVPDSREDAANYFEVGLYKVSVETTVGADGKLKIGARKSANVANDWMVLDNFRLTYLGNPYVDVTITDALYATYVAPFDVDFTDAEVSAYAAQLDYTYVHLEPVTTVPAGTAIVVKADAVGTYPVLKTTDAKLGTENDLLAATEEVTADGSQYILAKVDDKVGFAKAILDTKIAAGKGYLVITGAGVKSFYPFNEDGETAIENVTANDKLNNGVIYNIAGQRISKLQKGINIVNGKKVLK